ncbi:MAG TPA: type I-U CRISPR-associated protein Cas7, partial [Candidatus Obscuribacterales bacterium]
MTKVDITKDCWQKSAIKSDGPVCLVIRAALEPVAGLARFQPAGFPEIGHVIYEAPRDGGRREKVCIVDSPASMANHLESVCLNGLDNELHPELAGMPYVRCVTDRGDSPSANQQPDRVVCTSLTEGHRIASDYFLEGLVSREWVPERKKSKKNGETVDPAHWTGTAFRDQLRKEFGIKEVKRDKTYFIWPEAWWNIYTTLFKYDPNSLLHGVMFAREQIKLYRILTAHLEATGAARVGTSGVKFDRLGKTTSGQPI